MVTREPPASSFRQQLDASMPAHLQLIQKQLQCLARHSDIRYQEIADCPSRFDLLIPFCYEQLRWQIDYQRLRDAWVPDLIFSDPTFNPLLLRHSNVEGIGEKLQRWSLSDERQLHSLLKQVLPAFMAHQRTLMESATASDSRLQFELDTIGGQGGPERLQLLYVQGQAGNPSKAVFVVGLDGIDLSCLHSFLLRTWGSAGALPPHTIERLQTSLYMKVVYRTRESAAAPIVSLHMPDQLEAVVVAVPRRILNKIWVLGKCAKGGRPKLPAWGSGSSLIEYLPEVVEAVQRHCKLAAACASSRLDLLTELAQTKLGPAVEADPIGARSSMFRIIHEGIVHTLFVDISPQFPEEQPSLALQWDEGEMELSYQEYPWSPRWEAKEMARRIYSFVKEQIQKRHKE